MWWGRSNGGGRGGWRNNLEIYKRNRNRFLFCYVALWGRLRRGRGLWGGVAFLLGWGCVLPVAINDYVCLIDIDLASVAIIVSPFVGLEHYIIVECLSWLYGYGCLKLGFGFASKARYFS